jgi:hypothetical protein
MKRAPILLLALLAACADGGELPPVELGGGGARLMTGNARSPLEAYENAYAQIHRQTYNVHLNLETRGQNLYAAREAMAILVRSMETMRAMAAPFERPRFDPYVERYQGWLKDLDRNVWGGSFLSDVDRTATEVKTKFSPAATEILVEFPDRAPAPAPAAKTDAPAPAPPPAARAPAAGIPSDKVELPTGTGPAAPVPPPPPSGAPAAAPPAAAPSPASARIYYKAWDRAHDDLVASVKAKKDARRNYEDVIESLRLLKGQTAAPDKAKKLEIYLDYYAAVHEKTKGFTALPEGEKVTEKDVADELDVAARVLRSLFNPDK